MKIVSKFMIAVAFTSASLAHTGVFAQMVDEVNAKCIKYCTIGSYTYCCKLG